MKVTKKFLSLAVLFTVIACAGADTSVQTSGAPVTIELIVENPIERHEEAVEPSQAPVEAPESASERRRGPVYSHYVFPEVDWLEVEKAIVSSS